jgi:hypothetical protein
MTFVLIYSFPLENRNAIQARFKETGGGMPPAGVKLLSRWHAVGGGKGINVFESDDPLAIAKYANEWSDLMSFEIYPVVNDESIAKVIG